MASAMSPSSSMRTTRRRLSGGGAAGGAVRASRSAFIIDPPPYPSPRRGRETLFHVRLRDSFGLRLQVVVPHVLGLHEEDHVLRDVGRVVRDALDVAADQD